MNFDQSFVALLRLLVGNTIRKIEPNVSTTPPKSPYLKEIERLAQTAPHLLADVGFQRDPFACSPGAEVWRRGAVTACVVTQTGTVTVAEQ